MPNLSGRAVLITGAASGIGAAAARRLAAEGARLVLADIDGAKVEKIAGELGQVGLQADVTRAEDIERMLEEAYRRWGRLDVLVNNAGVLTEERSLSRDGIELTLATNVVGPFLLTKLLTPLLLRSAPARVINVSSGGMYTQGLHVDDLQSSRGNFSGTVAYARTKRIEVVLSELLAWRLDGTGVVVNAMHPGWVDTPGLRTSLPGFHRVLRRLLRTPDQGADTIVWLGSAPQAGYASGAFWFDRARRRTHLLPWTRERDADRKRLWTEVERLSG
jgi:NAD(P)-dependent dehydrogenase (short-subunit alcohol dehydrogenase family)